MNERRKLLPKLRFPEFQGAGAWATQKLGSVAFLNRNALRSKLSWTRARPLMRIDSKAAT